MPTRYEIFGIKELDDFFNNLKQSDQRKIVQNAFRIGAKPLIQVARQNLKIKTRSKGLLKKSIGFVPFKSSRTSVFVSAKVGARRFGNYKGYHGHLYDAGTTSRQTKKGFARGTMPATHFFTNSENQTSNSLINVSQQNFVASLDKMIQSGLKRQAKAAANL